MERDLKAEGVVLTTAPEVCETHWKDHDRFIVIIIHTPQPIPHP